MLRTKNYITLMVVLLLASLIVACGGAPAAEEAPAQEEAFLAGDAAPAEMEVENEAPLPGQPAFERLIIRTANLSLQVEDVAATEAAITARADELGGYVVSVETSGTDDNLSTSIQFRVPAEEFDTALADTEALAERILSRSISGDDVTEEFVDLDARLRNLEATEERLLTLLSQADTVEAALAVSSSLTEVQGQIEQVRGRMQYLQQSAALSTITVRLSVEPAPPPIVDEDGWQPGVVAQQALRALVFFGQALANLAIVLLVFTPVWLPFVLLGLWLLRRHRRRPQNTPPPAAPDTAR
jgi:hypothetical protein